MTPSGPQNSLYGNTLSEGSQKNRQGFSLAIIIGFAALWTTLFAFVSLRILPPIDGALFPLSNTNWLPYRDYYFPTTPGSYFIALISGSVSNEHSLLIFRIIGLLFVPLFFWSLYRLARLNLSRISSAIVASFGMSVMYKLGIEVLGGWNLIPLILFSTAFTLMIVAKNNHSVPTWQISKINFKLLGAGVCFGLSIVFKHTFFIQLIAAFILYLAISAVLVGLRSTKEQVLSKDLCWMILGLIIPLSLLSYWIISNSLLDQFYKNISSMGGKNPQLFVITQDALDSFLNAIGNPAALALIALLLSGSSKFFEIYTFRVGTVSSAVFLYVYLSTSLYVPRLGPAGKIFTSIYLLLFVAVSIIAIRKLNSTKVFPRIIKYGISIGIAIQLGALIINAENVSKKLNALALPDLVFVNMTFILCMAGLAYSAPESRRPKPLTQNSKFELNVFIFVFAIVASSLINIASSGGELYLIWMIGPFTWIFTRLLSTTHIDRQFVSFGVLLLSLASVANISYGITNPYTWHNWKDPSLTWKARSSTVPELYGISPATGVASFYEKLRKVESRAAKLSKTEDPKIFSFGGIPMASAISGMSPYEGSYCKFQWMDLCPQKVIFNDLAAIRNNSPDVIVIEEIPDSIIALHEEAFLKETSEVRKYYSYAYSQTRLGKWVKVGTLKQPQGNLVISVYYSTEHNNN